jgi:hypothetical protein
LTHTADDDAVVRDSPGAAVVRWRVEQDAPPRHVEARDLAEQDTNVLVSLERPGGGVARRAICYLPSCGGVPPFLSTLTWLGSSQLNRLELGVLVPSFFPTSPPVVPTASLFFIVEESKRGRAAVERHCTSTSAVDPERRVDVRPRDS